MFLNNFERGAPANLTSGSANTAVSGDDSLILKLQRGEWIKYITGSQHTAGTGGSAVTGVYSASFALNMFSADAINDSGETLLSVLNKSGSVVFQEYWTSIDGTVGYYTGSLEVKKPQRTSYSSNPVDLLFNFINLNESYRKDDVVKIRIFVDDLNAEEKVYKANPSYQFCEERPLVYVGMTGRTPEIRFQQHCQGYKASKFTRSNCVRLRPDLYKGLNPMSYRHACRMEVSHAKALRRRGFAVWQN